MDDYIAADSDIAPELVSLLSRQLVAAKRKIEMLEKNAPKNAAASGTSAKTANASRPDNARSRLRLPLPSTTSSRISTKARDFDDKKAADRTEDAADSDDNKSIRLRRSVRGKHAKCKACVVSAVDVQCTIVNDFPLVKKCARCKSRKQKCVWPTENIVSDSSKRKRAPSPVARHTKAKKKSAGRLKSNDTGQDTDSDIVEIHNSKPKKQRKRTSGEQAGEDIIERDIAAEMTGLYGLIGEVRQATAQTNVEMQILKDEQRATRKEIWELISTQKEILKLLRAPAPRR